MQLRDYQERIVTGIRNSMARGHRSVLGQAATGSGKTVIAAHMLQRACSKGLLSYITVHRNYLVDQTCEKLRAFGVDHGVIAAGHPMQDRPVQVVSIQTLARRMEQVPIPKFLVVDEAHHIAAGQWSKMFERYSSAHAVLLTATPHRLDGKGLDKFASDMVLGPPVRELINAGALCDYRYVERGGIDMSGVKKSGSDYNRKEMANAVAQQGIVGDLVKTYKEHAHGKRGVVFCASVELSKKTAQDFCDAGYRAVHLDAKTPKAKRAMEVLRFRNGGTDLLLNCDLFGEGFDVPGIEVVIQARPTQSETIYLQQVGRALRPKEDGSKAIIIDHVGNRVLHGLPCIEREWSLQGAQQKEKKPQTELVRICPQCQGAQEPGRQYCEFCDYKFEVKKREIAVLEGELVELTKEQLLELRKKRKRRAQAEAKSLDELRQLAQRLGHKPAWADHVWDARRRKAAS